MKVGIGLFGVAFALLTATAPVFAGGSVTSVTVWNCADDRYNSSYRVCSYNGSDSEMDVDYNTAVVAYGKSATLKCKSNGNNCHLKFAPGSSGCYGSDMYSDSKTYSGTVVLQFTSIGEDHCSKSGSYDAGIGCEIWSYFEVVSGTGCN